MGSTLADKLRLAARQRAHLVDMPPEIRRGLAAPPLDVNDDLEGEFDHIHLFCRNRTALDSQFPVLRDHLAPRGQLWVSWPKARQLGTDLTLAIVIEVGYCHGLVESKAVSIDRTWSALRFTHPKPGVAYHNRYGNLPG